MYCTNYKGLDHNRKTYPNRPPNQFTLDMNHEYVSDVLVEEPVLNSRKTNRAKLPTKRAMTQLEAASNTPQPGTNTQPQRVHNSQPIAQTSNVMFYFLKS